MASVWMRAAAASSSTAMNLVRASRTGLLSQRPAHRLSSVRWQSALAALQKDTEPVSLDPGAPATPMDLEVPPADKKGGMYSDQPEFSSLKGKISNETLKAITVKPFKLVNMSVVQAAVLPLLPRIAQPYDPEPPADGSPRPARDILVKAKTGTGKTLAFLVPAIEARIKAIEAHGKQAVKDAGLTTDKSLEARAKRLFAREHVGTVIISPTRELATQIANEALRLSHHHSDLEVRLFVGGVSKRNQMRDWMKGRRDIVVATPGRMRDLLESEPDIVRGMSKAKLLILDEADTLLDMGFREDIEAITKFLPPTPERQTFLFSATVSTAIQQVARAVMDKNHVFINCVSDDSSPVHAHVTQYHTVLPTPGDQVPHILRLLAHDQLINAGKSKVIVFLPTTKMTQLFTTFLRELRSTLPAAGATHVYEIHSKRTQEMRTKTSHAFRNDRSGASVLVTSDVSARGVDYPGVTRVIQVGIPGGTEQYVHRVGRTGRGNDVTGRADLVLLPWEIGFVTWQLTDIPLKPLTVNELKNQVTDLAKKYDEDPNRFFQGQGVRIKPGNDGPRLHPVPYTPKHESMGEEIANLLSSLDEEAIKETMASLLGYYVAKSHELRVQRSIILTGCKDWTVEACGLATPPYVSPHFLEKIGMSDGRTKHFGKAPNPRDDRSRHSSGAAPWIGRGSQHKRDRERMDDRRRTHEFSEGPTGDRRPSRDFGDEDGPSRPPRREFGGEEGRPRREFGGDEGRPRRDFGSSGGSRFRRDSDSEGDFGRPRREGSFGRSGHDSKDPAGDPMEYRSTRYNKRG